MKDYRPQDIEQKWQKRWEDQGLFDTPTDVTLESKQYILPQLPYPSGSGLHVGHAEVYAACDIYARFQRMNGKSVLQVMGWDSFGLPAENYAIKTNTHPRETIEKTTDTFRAQIKSLGISVDWNREVSSSNPDYYKWTQWLFLLLVQRGLAYRKEQSVNWCENDKTVLANDQVKEGRCERCDTVVVQKQMEQWYVKITDYAEQLLEGLDRIDWPEETKKRQRDWIGKSEGAEVSFAVRGRDEVVRVFTTRPDTLFGATYMVLAPEHEYVHVWKDHITNWDEVEAYVDATTKKTELDRQIDQEKTGVELQGVKAVHPLTGDELPIWIADYVLASYGTGAIMAVPAHDERDWAFAKQFGLPIVPVYDWNIELLSEQKGLLEVYTEKIEEYLANTPSEPGERFLDWLDATVDGISKESSILELGSGGGRDAAYFEQKGYTIIRTDGAAGFVQHLKKKGHQVRQLNIASEHIGWNEYDVIFANGVFVHFTVEQTRCLLKKVRRALKAGGRLSFSLKRGEGTTLSTHKLGKQRFFQCWKKEDVVALLQEEGFEIIRAEEPSLDGGEYWMDFIAQKVREPFEVVADIAIHSDFLNGMPMEEAKAVMIDHLEKNNLGERKTQYKLRDWSVSRQRFWGAPIPMLYDEQGELHPVPLEDLPVELPDDVDFKPTGESPLKDSATFQSGVEEKYGVGWRREVDTLDTFMCSSWYFFRYLDPKNDDVFASEKQLNMWMPVDFYLGGAEHVNGHLLYARFMTKVLYDAGYIDFDEPFTKHRHQGLILGEDGRKMSKRWGNVINPTDVVNEYGADTTRMYEMFMGPLEEAKPWSTGGVKGVRRFLEKVWHMQDHIDDHAEPTGIMLHQTIKKVSDDTATLQFNTAIAKMMELVNVWQKKDAVQKNEYEILLLMLAPYAPHMAEEIWETLGHKDSITTQKWPTYDASQLHESTMTIAVQVNGKLRATIDVSVDAQEDVVRELALAQENVQKWLHGNEPKKVIYVKQRLVSIVV